MAYVKKRGVLQCVIVGCTPLWIDAINSKSGSEATIFLKRKMSDKMKAAIDRSIASGRQNVVSVERMEESNYYRFLGFSTGRHFGHRNAIKKKMSYESLEREITASAHNCEAWAVWRDGPSVDILVRVVAICYRTPVRVACG